MDITVSTESLEGLIQTFILERDNLLATTSNLTSQLESAQWQSPRATEFRAAWAEQYVPVLNNLIAALESYQGDVQTQLQRYVDNA